MHKVARFTSAVVLLLFFCAPVPAHEDEKTSGDCDRGLQACVAEKRREWSDRGTLGMMIHPDEKNGTKSGLWFVHKVIPKGAAHDAGIAEGDLIKMWDGVDLTSSDPKFINRALQKVKIGGAVTIEVLRKGEVQSYRLIPRKPEPVTVDYWLMIYVYENFSHEEFERYQQDLRRRMKSGQND